MIPSTRANKGFLKICISSFWILSLFQVSGLIAQINNLGKPLVKNFPREVYNGGTHNWEIDEIEGRKLFANNDGLLIFDGNRWDLYQLPDKSIARSVKATQDGKIYVGGQDEIGYFYPDAHGRLEYISIKERIPEAQRSLEDVWDIEVIDSLIFARSVNKIFIFKADTVEVFDPKNTINFLKISGETIYFNSYNEGLYSWQNNELATVENSLILSDKLIVSIAEIDDKLIVFTASDGIYEQTDNGFKSWNTATNKYFRDKEIIAAEKSGSENIAVGTALHGIFIFNKDGNIIQQLDKNSGLQNNNVLSIMQDKVENIWIGTSNGIDNIINDNKRYIFPDGEQQGGIYDIAVYHDSIFFGTNNGLYSCEWKSYYNLLDFDGFKFISKSAGQVWGLDTIGNSLFMGHNAGAFVIENNKAVKISPDPGYWKFIGVDNNRKVIAGGYEGLSLFENRNGKWQFIKKYEGFKESSRLVIKENDYRFWIAHPYRGIFQINFDESYENISVKKYTTEEGLPSLLRNHVFLINNKPVIAGENNVYRYIESLDRFSVDYDFEKLLGPGNRVLRLFQDPDKKIWYLTDKDFGYFEIDENLLNRNFKKVSLPKLADEFVKGFEELHFLDNNDIMIPTESGVIQLINPGNQKPLTPEALLSKVKILNHKDSIIYGGFNNDNLTEEDGPSEIVLPYNQNYLRFEYFNSTFSSSEDVYYKPYIEGIDENDDFWTQETYKDYSRLPHGSYTFAVSSKNKYGDIGQVSRFSFTIKPPWYESILFNVIYLLVAFLILAGLILIPRSKYRRKVRDLENVQEKSKDEIDQLKNDKLIAELDFKNKQLASSMMHIVQKNEVLNKVKEEAKILKKYIKDPKAEKELRKLISILSNDERLDEDWEKFTFYFDQVHTDFLRRLKYEHPALSPKDQKLCAYLRMNLTTKEIAPLLNISVRGVEISRYRLRKKLELDPSTNLNEFMMHY